MTAAESPAGAAKDARPANTVLASNCPRQFVFNFDPFTKTTTAPGAECQ